MNEERLKYFHVWFGEYVKGFYSQDPFVHTNILLKEAHTQRVCENIVQIGQSIHLSTQESMLAEVVALFHDVGRFEQFKKYKTFSDGKSEDHSQMGIRILMENGILSNFEEKEKQILLKAIQYHNQYQLPVEETSEVLLFSKLIRDADKLDIFEILIEHYGQSRLNANQALDQFPDGRECSPDIIHKVLHHERIKYQEIVSLNDMKLLRISWVFDINFPFTFLRIREKRYIEKILELLPQTPQIKRIEKDLDKYLANHSFQH